MSTIIATIDQQKKWYTGGAHGSPRGAIFITRIPLTIYLMDSIYKIERGSYPETLENMKGPPIKLYYRGVFPAPKGQKYLCVVGSRKWTAYGHDAANSIISGLRGYPISIVSGLAIGIDSILSTDGLQHHGGWVKGQQSCQNILPIY